MVPMHFVLVLVILFVLEISVCNSFNVGRYATLSSRRMEISMVMDEFVEKKLDSIKRTFNALTERLSDPDLANDRKQMLTISRERSSMEPTVIAFNEWKRLEDERIGLVGMEQDSSADQDIKEMSRQVRI